VKTFAIPLLSILFFTQLSFSQIINDGIGAIIFFSEEDIFYDGQLILSNNDTISGSISLNHFKKDGYVTKFEDDKGLRPIFNKDISQVILTHTDKNGNTTQTLFLKLDDSLKFYRVLKEGSVTVFDSSVRPYNGNLVASVLIKSDEEIIDTFNFWTSGPKQDLINYLNEREGTSYKRRDFKSVDEIISLVVE